MAMRLFGFSGMDEAPSLKFLERAANGNENEYGAIVETSMDDLTTEPIRWP